MGRIGRPGNETSTQPVAIYLAQTSSETYYIKKLIFTKSVRTYPRLANADVELKGHLLSACSSISNSCFVKAKSMQQGNMPYLFSLQDIREFFSHIPSAADEDLKRLILHRTTNCLISLVNTQEDTIFIDLRKLVYRLLNLYSTAKYQDVSISGGDAFKLICGMEYLAYSNMKSNPVSIDVVKAMKDALRGSILLTFQNSTLCELARIFRGMDINQDISWAIAKIQGLDKHYLAIGLSELSELFKKDDNVSSVPGLNQRMDRVAWWMNAMVDRELENIQDKKHLSWLTRIRACRLNRPLLLKFESLLESDAFLETLMCFSADNTTSNKNLPRYLNWVKTGEKQGFELTNFGRICCSHGISTKTCDELYKWLDTGVGNGKILEINEARFFRSYCALPMGHP